MEFTNEQKKSQELLRKVIYRAWEDETFKQELLVNPVEAIKNATGETVYLPKDKTLIVRDQTNASTIYINITTEPNMEDAVLNDEELELVAGGGSRPTPVLSILPTSSGKDGRK